MKYVLFISSRLDQFPARSSFMGVISHIYKTSTNIFQSTGVIDTKRVLKK